jgi:hypothetical protein
MGAEYHGLVDHSRKRAFHYIGPVASATPHSSEQQQTTFFNEE